MYTLQVPRKNLAQITLFVLAIHAVLILWMILVPSSVHQSRKQTERLVVKTVQLHPLPLETPKVQTQVIEAPIPESAFIEIEPEPIPQPVIPMIEEIIEETVTVEAIQQPEELVKIPEPEKWVKPAPIKKVEIKTPPVEKSAPVKKIVKKNEPIKKAVSQKNPAAKKNVSKQAEKVKKPILEKPKIDPQVEAAKAKAQQAAQEKQKKLLAAAQESIAKIDQGRAKMNAVKSSVSSVVAPVAITSLQIDALSISQGAPLSPEVKSYRDELASRLKLMLKLPELGDVQLKLTLDRTGTAVKVTITKSTSNANRSYVEKTLPSLKFPPLGNYFENSSEYTFIIQLSNE